MPISTSPKERGKQMDMIVELDVKGRINLLSILPREGTLVDMLVLAELKKSIGFNAEELEKLQFSYPSPNVTMWNVEAAESIGRKQVSIPKVMTEKIAAILKSLDRAGRVQEGHLEFFKLFVIDEEQPSAGSV